MPGRRLARNEIPPMTACRAGRCFADALEIVEAGRPFAELAGRAHRYRGGQ
jgi:hypothetical protein